MSIGLRVVRGPDWNLGNKDQGEGHVGTVVKDNGDDTYNVFWDMGEKTTCRGGKGGKSDLIILDNAPTGNCFKQFSTHPEVTEAYNMYSVTYVDYTLFKNGRLHTSNCIIDSLKCIIDSLKCIIDRLKCIIDSLKCIIDSLKCIIDSLKCIIDSLKCIPR